MRTFKSIERPAQVLGISFQDLGLVVGVLLVGGILLGVLGMAIKVPGWLNLLLLVITVGLYFALRFLTKHHPPGFLVGFLSYRIQQPRRLTLGAPTHPASHEKRKDGPTVGGQSGL